jgi:3D (Asp-Asp-Asp) domain-containing protein
MVSAYMKKWLVIVIALIIIFSPGVYILMAEKKTGDREAKYVWKPVKALVTHYCWKEKLEKRWKGKTALNTSAKNDKGIAVDPTLIPYGSVVLIPGVGIRTADDTGGRCKKYGQESKVVIDVRWEDKTARELKQLGSKEQVIYVLERVPPE